MIVAVFSLEETTTSRIQVKDTTAMVIENLYQEGR